MTRSFSCRRTLAACLCCIALFATTAPARAEEVTLRHRGLTLNASLDLAPGKRLLDGVVLITHGGLAHRDMEMITALRGLLNQKGYSTLAINLSLGLNNRHGMYDCKVTHRHLNTDAAEENGVWLDWLKQRGATRVTLLGHSRGGAQTAFYVAGHRNPLLRNVVLIAPAIGENTNAAEYQRRFNAPLAPVLARAQQALDTQRGDTVLTHVGLMNCANTSATARSFVSYYGRSPGLDTPSLLPKLSVPTLVLVAGSDEVVVGLADKVAPLLSAQIQMKVIEGSNHTFQDLYVEEAIDAVDAFLQAHP